MKNVFKACTVALVLSGLLGGCAVYGPPPTYSEMPYYDNAPVYVAPAPVYVHPAPIYVGPPVWFGLNFGYRGGHSHGHGWRHGHGGPRHGHGGWRHRR
jgi:predicted small lipoprotein YifL